jgi:hypothetical protein
MVRAWHGHGMVSVNQKRPHCVNEMGKTHSKPLAARHGHGNGMGTAWARHVHGMASVNQTRPHCLNEMGKTHSKPLAARHGHGNGMGTAWARHGKCESAFIQPPVSKNTCRVVGHVTLTLIRNPWLLLTCGRIRGKCQIFTNLLFIRYQVEFTELKEFGMRLHPIA